MSETEYVLVPRDLVAFLLGEGDYDGLSFGDSQYTEGGHRVPYWWRAALRACVAASPAPAASRATDPRTGRPFGDHGKGSQAIRYALDKVDPDEIPAFLEAWEAGDLEPDYYRWLAALPDAPVPAKDGEGEG